MENNGFSRMSLLRLVYFVAAAVSQQPGEMPKLFFSCLPNPVTYRYIIERTSKAEVERRQWDGELCLLILALYSRN